MRSYGCVQTRLTASPRQLQYLLHPALGLFLLLPFIAAHAGDRLALVIGNANYITRPLVNSANDAKAMKQKLEALGFKVVYQIDADDKSLKKSVREFLNAAPKYKVRMLYYSGHGVQVSGDNYLLPISPVIENPDHLRKMGTSVSAIIDHLRGGDNKLNIVVLDACRDTPFPISSTRGLFNDLVGKAPKSGLAMVNAGRGTLIAYATEPGKVAYDGKGPNSPFTRRLIEYMDQPGLTLQAMFQQVANGVYLDTVGKQLPWLSYSLVGGEFCFKANEQGRCGNA